MCQPLLNRNYDPFKYNATLIIFSVFMLIFLSLGNQNLAWAEGHPLGQDKTVTWNHPTTRVEEKRVQLKLLVDGPQQTGSNNLYHLKIHSPKALNDTSAMGLSFDQPGSIMVSIEDDAKFFIEKKRLHYKAALKYENLSYRMIQPSEFTAEETTWGGFEHQEVRTRNRGNANFWKTFGAILFGMAVPVYGSVEDAMTLIQTAIGPITYPFACLTHDFTIISWQWRSASDVPAPFQPFNKPDPDPVFTSDRKHDTLTISWQKFERDDISSNEEINFWFTVGREAEVYEASTLYLRVLLPYRFMANASGNIVSIRYAEIEWKVHIPETSNSSPTPPGPAPKHYPPTAISVNSQQLTTSLNPGQKSGEIFLPAGTNSFTLSWTDNSDEKWFKIRQHDLDNNRFSVIETVAADQTSLQIDADLIDILRLNYPELDSFDLQVCAAESASGFLAPSNPACSEIASVHIGAEEGNKMEPDTEPCPTLDCSECPVDCDQCKCPEPDCPDCQTLDCSECPVDCDQCECLEVDCPECKCPECVCPDVTPPPQPPAIARIDWCTRVNSVNVSQQESYLVGPPDGRMGGLRDRTSKAIFSGCSNDRRYDPDALASLLGVNPGILSQADVIAFEYNGSRNTNFESSRWMFRGGGSYVKSEHQFDNPTVVSNPTDSNQVIAHGRVDPGKYRSFFDTSTLGSGTVAFLLFDLPDSIVKAPDFKVELYPGKNIQNGTPDIDAVGVLP